MTQIVLASTSPFRKALLDKFNINFATAKPNVDETAFDGETAEQLVARLAKLKAQAVANDFPNALIIGSDQVALSEGNILGKPHTHENAVKQLQSFSGKTVTFLTGLCVHNSKTNESEVLVEPFYVNFRELTDSEINNYLLAEQPYNCAGSFKSEALGICLFESLEGADPNTLIGLPLIRLHQLLKNQGFDVLAQQ
ncbi:nucleoside triphosphate pyrophosphatase [Thalassotalea maritima]|uniref:Maf family protein n=1 Tax=Thalassotalea maritima TaxID=3242416 RepID=UPI003528DE61